MPPKSKAPLTQHPILLLTQSGDVTTAAIPAAGLLSLPAIQTFLKKKKGIECIATYKLKPITLNLFGASEGKEETQNQHQLPPPHDSTAFYGDIVLVASKTDDKSFGIAIPFTPENYEEFYTKIFDGGYDSETAEELPEEEEPIVEDLEGDLDADAEADAEEDEEQDAEEEEGEAEEAAIEDDDAPTPKVKTKKKKPSAKAAAKAAAILMNGMGSGYPDPPILSEEEQLKEESAPGKPLHPKRQHIINCLQTLFSTNLSEKAIYDLERCIYNGAIHQSRNRHIVCSCDYALFVELYKMHAMHISSNFHPDSYVQNTELFDGYQKGEITFETLAAMNTYELFPSRWREMFEQQQIREKKELEGNRDRATDQFTCTRCWKKVCTYYEMQTRSADEPMTIFITCLNCGKKWRQ